MNPGATVLKLNGSIGVGPSGSVVVYDASGNCDVCCDPGPPTPPFCSLNYDTSTCPSMLNSYSYANAIVTTTGWPGTSQDQTYWWNQQWSLICNPFTVYGNVDLNSVGYQTIEGTSLGPYNPGDQVIFFWRNFYPISSNPAGSNAHYGCDLWLMQTELNEYYFLGIQAYRFLTQQGNFLCLWWGFWRGTKRLMVGDLCEQIWTPETLTYVGDIDDEFGPGTGCQPGVDHSAVTMVVNGLVKGDGP